MDKSQKIMSDVVIWSKYSKFVPELNRRETWDEIVDRNVSMHIKKYPQIKDEIKQAYKYVREKKVLPSMRSMQFGGTPIDVNNSRIYNCAYAPVDSIYAFSEAMFLLLGGTGYGYSVQKQHVDKLPVIKGTKLKSKKFLIADSIEGWADSVKILVKAFTEERAEPVFDYKDIRPKGARLITAGGKAPGPEPLRLCLEKLRSILRGAVGRKLKTIECHDMMCHIADAVLTGGIRRAAMISFFSHDDQDMLYCKAGSWWEMSPERGRSNNSAVLVRGEITKEQFEKVWDVVKNSGSGEPGVYWTNDADVLSNPCVC